jgi:hypothetical protein
MPVSPLPPEIHTQSPADPRFEVGEHNRGLAEAEIAAPSDQVWTQPLDDLWQGFTPCPACSLPDLHLEVVDRFRRDAPLAPVIRNAEAEKLPLLRARHRALRLVDRQLELPGQEPAHRGHDAFTGTTTADVNVRIVSILAKRRPRRSNSLSRSSSKRLLRSGESGPPCGVPSSTGRTRPFSITPALRNARISLSTRLALRLSDRLMSGAPRPEAVAEDADQQKRPQ